MMEMGGCVYGLLRNMIWCSSSQYCLLSLTSPCLCLEQVSQEHCVRPSQAKNRRTKNMETFLPSRRSPSAATKKYRYKRQKDQRKSVLMAIGAEDMEPEVKDSELQSVTVELRGFSNQLPESPRINATNAGEAVTHDDPDAIDTEASLQIELECNLITREEYEARICAVQMKNDSSLQLLTGFLEARLDEEHDRNILREQLMEAKITELETALAQGKDSSTSAVPALQERAVRDIAGKAAITVATQLAQKNSEWLTDLADQVSSCEDAIHDMGNMGGASGISPAARLDSIDSALEDLSQQFDQFEMAMAEIAKQSRNAQARPPTSPDGPTVQTAGAPEWLGEWVERMEDSMHKCKERLDDIEATQGDEDGGVVNGADVSHLEAEVPSVPCPILLTALLNLTLVHIEGGSSVPCSSK